MDLRCRGGWILVGLVLTSYALLPAQRPRPLIAPPEFAIDQWTTADGLPQNSVNAILQTRDGYLWVGTFGGLARFDGSTFSLIDRSDGSGRHIGEGPLTFHGWEP